MRTLFPNPPSFQGFDGGAGSRYQARREIRSFWYPDWLAQAAALVEDSRLVDAPPDDLTVEDVTRVSRDFDLAIIYTRTPSFANDAEEGLEKAITETRKGGGREGAITKARRGESTKEKLGLKR